MNKTQLDQKAKEVMDKYNLERDTRVQIIKKLISDWGIGIVEMYELVQKAYISRIKGVENEQDK